MAAVEGELAGLPLVVAVADLAHLAQLPVPALLVVAVADLAHLAQHLPLLALLPLLLALALVEAVVLEALAVVAHPRTRSFSAAMAGILPSLGPPTYAAVPRSRRKPKRRPCPLA